MQSFDDFLSYVIDQETDPNFPKDSEVRYAQTRQSSFLWLYPYVAAGIQVNPPIIS